MTIAAVHVRGSYHGPTGHDHHVRSFTRELVWAGVAVKLTDMPQWSARRLPAELRDPWFDTLHDDVGANIFLQFCMPHQVVSGNEMGSVNFTMFEADRIPKSWRKAAERSVLTILPEESSRAAWMAGGVPPERLRLCPLGIDPDLFSRSVVPVPLLGSTGEDFASRRVRFLNLSEFVPRKNQKGLLRAWLHATNDRDDAVLVIKPGGKSPEDDHRLTDLLRELEEQEGRDFVEAAPIHVISETLAASDVPRLYAAATHYISMSFGEGWDLPMVEAAASGLQLIAPDHTAYRHYLTSDIATLIPTRKVPAAVSRDFKLLFEQAHWWEPDLDAATQAVRDAIDGRESAVASARDFVLGHFTWERATQRLIDILSEAETLGSYQE